MEFEIYIHFGLQNWQTLAESGIGQLFCFNGISKYVQDQDDKHLQVPDYSRLLFD